MFLMATTTELRQLIVKLPIYSVFFLTYFRQSAESGSPSTSGCVCPGDTLIYECTVKGFGATIWTGSALHCPNSGNALTLLHTLFLYNGSSRLKYCNKGGIVARTLSVEGNNYTSQLNVTVTPDTAGNTIECGSDNGTDYKRLFTWTIPTVTGPPNTLGISNVDLSLRQLTFSWSPVATDCPAIHYNILASNCGSCPTTTNHTNVTCTDVPTDNKECTFIIQTVTVVCANITGNPISINTHTFYSRDTNTAYIVSISSLAIFSIVSTSALVIVTVIILMRNKIKTRATLNLQATTRAVSSTQVESMYEEPIPSVSAIKTRDNIAYGHTKTTTT